MTLPRATLLFLMLQFPGLAGDQPGSFTSDINLSKPPSPLAIIDETWRQKRPPFWSSWLVPRSRPLADFTFELISGPQDLTLSDDGFLEWSPGAQNANTAELSLNPTGSPIAP